MNFIENFSRDNLDVIYFIYGSAFAAMGLAILIYPKKNSGFPLADKLDLLGWFGVVHGANEFLDMWQLIRGSVSSAFSFVKLSALLASYIFLFEFGRTSFRPEEGEAPPGSRKAARFPHRGLLPGLLLLVAALSSFSESFIQTAAILSRYLLGFPGALLAGWSILDYSRRKEADLRGVKAFN